MASNQNGGDGRIPTGSDLEAGKLQLKKKLSKNTSTREEKQTAMRTRSHSNGSTLGAFYQNDPPPAKAGGRRASMAPGGAAAAAIANGAGGGGRRASMAAGGAAIAHGGAGGGPRRRRPSKRHKDLQQHQPKLPTELPAQKPPLVSTRNTSHPPPTYPMQTSNNNTGSDLGDVASLAIAGLGDDIDISELMGGSPPPSRNNNRRAPPPTQSSSVTPPSSRRVARPNSGSQLPTIHDDSEVHQLQLEDLNGGVSFGGSDTSTPDYFRKTQNFDMYGGVNSGRRSTNRMSTNTVDSLRVSDVSAGMEEDVAGMLSSLDRDYNMWSDASGVLDQSDSRVSLFGSNILDRPSSASLLQQQQQQQQKGFNSNYRPPLGGGGLPPTAPPSHTKVPSQQEEIANFAAMLHADYGAANDGAMKSHPLLRQGPSPPAKKPLKSITSPLSATSSEDDDDEIVAGNELTEDEVVQEVIERRQSRLLYMLDPTHWLTKDVQFDEDGVPYFDDSAWTLSGLFRYLLYNPISPEFTSLQQFCWAIILGIAMGFYTAFWKEIIEHSVEFMWEIIPTALLEWGVFTDLDGAFPLYHYMWICPAFWGGVLSYIFAVLPTPIPGQNEWIENLHTRGVQDSETFFVLFVLSTLGMASGLSLGPELPLVLTSGMIGSWLGIQCKQSVLQARVMNITCASAAIGGFFGFPMAGALFVMELPHRMGLQYFEALSPATIASIVAVLCNRLVTNNDVTGYYSYPFLSTSLPSEIFTSAIIFGLFGALVGTIYTNTVLKLKGIVHDFFHATHDHHDDEEHHDHDEGGEKSDSTPEKTPLIDKGAVTKKKTQQPGPPEPPFYQQLSKRVHKFFCCVIPYEPHRAAVAGVIAGVMVGVICMFVPHVMFWGEAQLQNLIDKGRTPLPVFGQEDEPTAALTALGYCMIDPNDASSVRAGFGIGCAFLITAAKIVTTGLSLGTGIIGGQFWGPLFVGCAASHFLTDAVKLLADKTGGFGSGLAAYPCVTILCTMGSTHVVTFRAHMAIMLILTLTISGFNPEGDDGNSQANAGVAGDYSAVFPLLVVSVFVALMVSRQTVFYKTQRSRGDIMALPEVLCEPGKEGMPMVLDYEGGQDDYYDDDESDFTSDDGYMSDPDVVSGQRQMSKEEITQADIEKEFNAKAGAMAMAAPSQPLRNEPIRTIARREPDSSVESGNRSRGVSPLPPRPQDKKKTSSSEFPRLPPTGGSDSGAAPGFGELPSSRLDELLAKPVDYQRPRNERHRRIQSAPDVDFGKRFQKQRSHVNTKDDKSLGAESGGTGTGGRHARSDSLGSQASGKVMRITTIGHLSVEQPSLMDQARLRSATSVIVESRHIRNPSLPSKIPRGGRHSRQNSASSIGKHSRQSSPSSIGRHSRHNSSSSLGAAAASGPPLSVAVAVDRSGITPSEIERAYTSAVHRKNFKRSPDGSPH